MLKPSDIVVRDFDGSKRMVHGEVDLPIKAGSQVFNSNYSCLLGRPWIHGAGAVTSMLHQKLKYPIKGKIVTVRGEEEFMVSHLNSLKYIEMDGEFVDTFCQAFEVVPPMVTVSKTPPSTPKAAKRYTKDGLSQRCSCYC